MRTGYSVLPTRAFRVVVAIYYLFTLLEGGTVVVPFLGRSFLPSGWNREMVDDTKRGKGGPLPCTC